MLSTEKLYEVLESLRLDNGLYSASIGSFYSQFCWLRDCFYESLPNLTHNPDKYKQTYHTLLDYLQMLESKYNKFSSIISNPHPKDRYRYLHARIDVKTGDEIHVDWMNKQNDVLGEILFGIALGEKQGIEIIRDNKDIQIIYKLINYLEALEYWHDDDSGIWEEVERVRSSSIGACVAGLKAIKELGFYVQQKLIHKGEVALRELLPRESHDRDCDMSLLTLIYPFKVVDDDMAKIIIKNVETYLLRQNGVIRYAGDWYFNNNTDGNPLGSEPAWVMGKLFLGLSYMQLGNYTYSAKKYLDEVLSLCPDGKIPELYYSNTDTPNENTPLGWSVALAVLLKDMIDKV